MTGSKSKENPTPTGQNTLRSVEKALGLLNHFSLTNPEFGLSELARTAKMDKATTLRCLTALERHGFVEQDPESRQYRLGLSLLRLARIRDLTFPFTTLIQPELDALVDQTGETAHVSALSGSSLVTIGALEPKRSVRASLEPAEVISLHGAASGLVLLAFGNGVRAEDLPEDLEAFTDTTITKRSDLLIHLDEVRRQGYAVARQSFEADVTGIAAPIMDRNGHAAAAIAVASVASRQTPESIAQIRDAVRAAAMRLTAKIGGARLNEAAK